MYYLYTDIKQSLDHLLQGEDASVWECSLPNKIGRLEQGVDKQRILQDKIAGTNTEFS